MTKTDTLATRLADWVTSGRALAVERDNRAEGVVESTGDDAGIAEVAADHGPVAQHHQLVAARAHATVTKVDASHLSMISHPDTVANVIEAAARHTS